MALSAKQQRFVAEYAIDLNATQAAIRAGYAAHTAKQQGSRLLTKADIKQAVDAVNTEMVERLAGSAEWIVERAVDVVNMGLASVPVRGRDGKVLTDGEGEPLAYEAYNLSAVNGALGLLAKRHPEFRESAVIVNNDNRTQVLIAEGRLGGHD